MKKKFSFIILFITFLISCEKKVEIPEKSEVIAKYIVFEDSISRKIIKELDSIEPFDKKNNDYKQPFKLDGKFFQFETEIKLSEGRLIKMFQHDYYTFKYSTFGIKKLKINLETIGKETSIKFSKSREEIIDYKDTLDIETVYPKEKLIFVKRNDQRINIYEYK
jgi:hypothetical protein